MVSPMPSGFMILPFSICGPIPETGRVFSSSVAAAGSTEKQVTLLPPTPEVGGELSQTAIEVAAFDISLISFLCG